MRNWMRDKLRRRKKPSSTENTAESTGKVGQPIDRTKYAPIVPHYPEPEEPGGAEEAVADDVQAEFGGKMVVETQPESPDTPPAPADAATKAPLQKREPR